MPKKLVLPYTLIFMANIVYFEIPADDVDRANRFYHSLLGWKIESTKVPVPDTLMQYQDITTGDSNMVTPMDGTLSKGGMYKRKMNEPIVNYVMVDNIDEKIAMVEKLGGRIAVPKRELESVGQFVIIQDTEGNVIALFKPKM
jgi:predicted enzyme related to lactoylglutathione lyase